MELQNLYRTTSPEELSFYEDRLYPLQDEVLEIASIYERNIYLTGANASNFPSAISPSSSSSHL